MPLSIMISDLKGNGSFDLVDATEQRGLGDVIKEAICSTCSSVLHFVPDEYAEADREAAVGKLSNINLFGGGPAGAPGAKRMIPVGGG